MAEIEEMKTENENTKTEEIRIDNRVTLTKVYVGGGDDFIVISGNDISIFDRFRAAGDELTALAEEMEKKESDSCEIDYKRKSRNGSISLKRQRLSWTAFSAREQPGNSLVMCMQ